MLPSACCQVVKEARRLVAGDVVSHGAAGVVSQA
jgi:hypothetical protein